MGSKCATTTAVISEYQAGIVRHSFPKQIWGFVTELKLTKVEQRLADQLIPQLGTGERTCIAVAVHRKGLFVSDDAKARQIAENLNVSVTGTLGILVLTIKRGQLKLAEGNQLLQMMIANGYRSPITMLNDFV